MDQEANNAISTTCPFCSMLQTAEILMESELAYAVYDKFPVNPGHSLVIPKKHAADYFDLTPGEQNACWDLVNKIKAILDQRFCPDGYNVGINNLAAAGQTVPHVHIHIIPRYLGDVERPEGGVRGVIPGKKEYSSDHNYALKKILELKEEKHENNT